MTLREAHFINSQRPLLILTRHSFMNTPETLFIISLWIHLVLTRHSLMNTPDTLFISSSRPHMILTRHLLMNTPDTRFITRSWLYLTPASSVADSGPFLSCELTDERGGVIMARTKASLLCWWRALPFFQVRNPFFKWKKRKSISENSYIMEHIRYFASKFFFMTVLTFIYNRAFVKSWPLTINITGECTSIMCKTFSYC